MNNAIVTGGAGFIGSHIAEALAAKGVQVTVIDNLVSGSKKNFEPWWNSDLCTFVEADITKGDLIRPFFADVDVVFNNAASKCNVCRVDPLRDLMVNARGAYSVFDCAQASGATVIHASTGSVYGQVKKQSEELPPAPCSFYGVSKLAGESYLRAFKDYHPHFKYDALRYFHVFGPRQSAGKTGGVIPIFINRIKAGLPVTIFGDGDQVRCFTHVSDVVKANLALAEKPTCQIYNVAAGVKITINKLARLLMGIMGKRVPIEWLPARPGDIYKFNVKTDALDMAIGPLKYKDFQKSLEKTVKWYCDNA